MSRDTRGPRVDGDIFEHLALIGLAVFLIGSGFGLALLTGLLERAIGWLVEVRVLVTESLVWTLGSLPGGQPVGLDLGRAFVLVLAVLLFLAASVYTVRARMQRTRPRDE